MIEYKAGLPGYNRPPSRVPTKIEAQEACGCVHNKYYGADACGPCFAVMSGFIWQQEVEEKVIRQTMHYDD